MVRGQGAAIPTLTTPKRRIYYRKTLRRWGSEPPAKQQDSASRASRARSRRPAVISLIAGGVLCARAALDQKVAAAAPTLPISSCRVIPAPGLMNRSSQARAAAVRIGRLFDHQLQPHRGYCLVSDRATDALDRDCT